MRIVLPGRSIYETICMYKVFIKTFDEALNNLVEILVIFITTSLGKDDNNETIEIIKK